jgi:hypothetical protein
MIKKYIDAGLIVTTVAFASALSGCAGGVAAISAAETSFISDVQALSSAACQFLPTADSIAAVFTAASAISATAETIAGEICQSLTSPTVSMRRAKLKMGVTSLPVITISGQSYVIQGSVIPH